MRLFQRYGFLLALVGMSFSLVSTVASEEIGRLFSTPAERMRLDNLRSGVEEKVVVKQDVAVEKPKPVAAVKFAYKPVFINGVVRLSGGREIVWINGKRVERQSTQDGVQVSKKSGKGYSVTVKGYGKAAQVKPGQVWNPDEGQVLERGDVSVVKEPSNLSEGDDQAIESGTGDGA